MDIVAIAYGALSPSQERALKANNITLASVHAEETRMKHLHEKTSSQEFQKELFHARLSILHLTQYELVLFIPNHAIVHRNCDNLFQAFNSSLNEFIGVISDVAPIDPDLFFVRPSTQHFVDISFSVEKGAFLSVQKGWWNFGLIPAYGPLEALKTDWSFAGGNNFLGAMYFLYFCYGPPWGMKSMIIPRDALLEYVSH